MVLSYTLHALLLYKRPTYKLQLDTKQILADLYEMLCIFWLSTLSLNKYEKLCLNSSANIHRKCRGNHQYWTTPIANSIISANYTHTNLFNYKTYK